MLARSLLTLLAAGVAAAQSILPPPPAPAGNPTTPDKVLLGKALFWDEQLSTSHAVACGTCHILERGGADPRAATSMHPGPDGVFGTDDDVHGSPGVPRHDAAGRLLGSPWFGVQPQVTSRRAPSVINAAYAHQLFVDGSADDVLVDPVTNTVVLPSGAALENQILRPPVSTTEMAHVGRTWQQIAADLPPKKPLALATQVPMALQQFLGNDDYAAVFARVFGSPGVTPIRIVFAIAAYERTLISDRSPFDLYLAGQGTLTTMESLGLTRFQTFCAACHADLDPAVLATGPVLDDFRNIGVRPVAEDPGRAGVTNLTADRGRFRVPGLRNVALRGSFFHNGGPQTLGEVIDFYARGGDFADNKDPLVDAINGHIQIADSLQLQALLNALTDPRVAAGLPPFDRPTLWSEGPGVHDEYPVPLQGGFAPTVEALGPARLGRTGFGVGAQGLPQGSFALLLLDRAGSTTPSLRFGLPTHLAASPALQAFMIGPTLPGNNGLDLATAIFDLPSDPVFAGDWWLQWAAIHAPAGGTATAILSDTLRFTAF